jgi:adenylate cyclase
LETFRPKQIVTHDALLTSSLHEHGRSRDPRALGNTVISEHEPSPDERVLGDALATLRALPELRSDVRASAALDELARYLDPDARAKSRRLTRAAHLVNASLDLDAVLGHALDLVVEIMNAERGFVILREGHVVAAPRNANTQRAPQALVDHALGTGEAIFASDAHTDPRWRELPSVGATDLRSIACVPLRVRERTIGVVYLDSFSRADLFRPSDREMLESFAYNTALAIENARLFEDERDRVGRISALQQFQTRILEAIANGVITLSPQREITTFNRAAETTFGIASEMMNGKAAFALAAVIPEFPELLETFFESGAVALRAEVDATRHDGTPLVLEMRLSPLESPEGKGVAMIVTDVTKQRGLEIAHEVQVEKATLVEASFSRYLAPHVVKSLMNDPTSIKLGGERSRATMFFADIRGFTSLAARLPAERVVEILNTYFDEAVKIVFAHDGMLDKFYGDGLMAVFGPPRVRGDDASRAVAAAIALHDVVTRLRVRLDYALAISIGLATGDVVAGHFGSAQRMDYTVIGDAVNLASGLQSAAPAGTIYCDDATFAAAGVITRPSHRLAARVKGREDLVTTYAIFPDESTTPI